MDDVIKDLPEHVYISRHPFKDELQMTDGHSDFDVKFIRSDTAPKKTDDDALLLAQGEINNLIVDNKRLRAALEFYASPFVYKLSYRDPADGVVKEAKGVKDMGQLARDVLYGQAPPPPSDDVGALMREVRQIADGYDMRDDPYDVGYNAAVKKLFLMYQTERTMHNAWRKRAEEAEAALPPPPSDDVGKDGGE